MALSRGEDAPALVLGPDDAGVVVCVVGGRITSVTGDSRPGEPAGSTRGSGSAHPAAHPSDAHAPAAPGAPVHLDCAGARIATGRVNAHTHLYSGLAPFGMPAPEPKPSSFLEILERVWWRLDRALDASSLRASVRHYAAEALARGTTTLVDHHESPAFLDGSLDVLAEALDEIGVRALVCYGATDRNGGEAEGSRGIAECVRFARDVATDRVRAAVGLHASFTVSDVTVRAAGNACRDLAVPLHVHVAEDGADVDDARQRGHAGPVERLQALDALPEGSILAHGVHLGPDQVSRVEDAGAWLVQNPRSNEANGVGYPAMLAHCTRVGLGTDGFPADMAEEAAALRAKGREHGEEDAVLDERVAGGWRLATAAWGTPFGADPAPDMAADLCVMEAGRARHAVVAGEVVLRDGALVGADADEIRTEAEHEARRLWRRMEAL